MLPELATSQPYHDMLRSLVHHVPAFESMTSPLIRGTLGTDGYAPRKLARVPRARTGQIPLVLVQHNMVILWRRDNFQRPHNS